MATLGSAAIEDYLGLPYRMEVYYDEGYWAAEFPELPGLVAGHETWEGLQAAVEDAKRAYFDAMLESGRPIPSPRPRHEEFSGRLVLRLPKSLHREAAHAAQREGASLNSFIMAAVADRLGRVQGPASRGLGPAGRRAVDGGDLLERATPGVRLWPAGPFGPSGSRNLPR